MKSSPGVAKLCMVWAEPQSIPHVHCPHASPPSHQRVHTASRYLQYTSCSSSTPWLFDYMHVVEYTIRVEPVELGYTRLISDNYLPGVTYISVGTVFLSDRTKNRAYGIYSGIWCFIHYTPSTSWKPKSFICFFSQYPLSATMPRTVNLKQHQCPHNRHGSYTLVLLFH